MRLLIPKDDAISIIMERFQEIDESNFNHKVWKERTKLDMGQIFGIASNQYLQISQLRFDTPLSSQSKSVYEDGKKSAKGLLTSYIDFIEKYSKIELARQQKNQEVAEDKYNKLLAEYNKVSEEYINQMQEESNLFNKYSDLFDENESIREQLSKSFEEINHLKNNTVQLDNVTLQRLWTVIKNLPTGQIVAIVTVIAGIIYFVFASGQLIEKNNANNDSFEVKKENSKLEGIIKSKQENIDSLGKIILMKNDTIQNIKKIHLEMKNPS